MAIYKDEDRFTGGAQTIFPTNVGQYGPAYDSIQDWRSVFGLANEILNASTDASLVLKEMVELRNEVLKLSLEAASSAAIAEDAAEVVQFDLRAMMARLDEMMLIIAEAKPTAEYVQKLRDEVVEMHADLFTLGEVYLGKEPVFPAAGPSGLPVADGSLFYYVGDEYNRGMYVYNPEYNNPLTKQWELLSSEGIRGVQGPEGVQGPPGPRGIQGIQGIEGPQGAVGPEGPDGPEGPQGIQGVRGDRGPTGPQGLKGDPGPTGPIGPEGIQGPIGLAPLHRWTGTLGQESELQFQYPDGSWGAKRELRGPMGPEGPEGERGPQGVIGPDGPIGPTGPGGPQGIQGPRGDRGPEGPQGIKGDTGPTGPKGPDGATGPTGPEGVRGADGTSFQVNEVVQTDAESDAFAAQAKGFSVLVIGHVNINGSTGALRIKMSDVYADWSEWIPFGIGPAGPQGPRGPEGPTGPTGERGPEGPEGPTGDTGAMGPMGPEGDRGMQGPQGIRGPKGEVGDQGSAGIQGPEGPRGDQGLPGAKGPQGDVGPTGTQGEPGPQGIRGEQGLPGDKGDTGAMGPMGPEGDRGMQGPQGLRGQLGPQGRPGIDGQQGPQGEIGPRGLQGPQGLRGPEGVQGPVGPKGPTGDKGAPGDQGPAGIAGRSSESALVGSLDSVYHAFKDYSTHTFRLAEFKVKVAAPYARHLILSKDNTLMFSVSFSNHRVQSAAFGNLELRVHAATGGSYVLNNTTRLPDIFFSTSDALPKFVSGSVISEIPANWTGTVKVDLSVAVNLKEDYGNAGAAYTTIVNASTNSPTAKPNLKLLFDVGAGGGSLE